MDGNDVSISLTDSNNNFLVALSALASNKSIVGYSYTPTDTMLVLDASGSMSESNYVDELVTSANSAIKKLLELNRHNRIGVVLYSGNSNFGNSSGSTATVLLPLDRYTQSYSQGLRQETDVFLANDGQNSISVNRGVKNSNNETVNRTTKNVVGGTYIQNGVYMAMEEFLEADTIIPDGMHQAGATRTPIFVLMSDGQPTTATTNYAGQNNGRNTVGLGTSNLGDGGEADNDALADAIDFVNQLTAAYVKAKVDEKYVATTPLFYTLGLGSGTNLNSPVLNPSAYANTDPLWENFAKLNNNSSLIVEVEEGRNPDTVSIAKIPEITTANQKNYVTEHFAASNSNGLISAFNEIVNQIIVQSIYYPTFVESGDHDNDGYVEFIDDIGHYMDVKDIKGIVLGDTLFTGERLAANFTPSGGELLNPDGSYSELGDNMVWSVQQRLGIANVEDARDLINSAFNYGQLYYDEQTGEWSNYIGWYADNDGNFLGHWHEGHTASDIPTGATYINKSYGMLGEVTKEHTETNMMYISTQIHTRISDGNVSFIWRIPASLVPVVSYNIHLDGETLADATSATINYVEAKPIRILFEVGLVDSITPFNVSEILVDKAEHLIDADHNGKNEYAFYTNWWNDDKLSHEHFSKTEDTVVSFEPSLQNEHYYYYEETAVYVKTGAGNDDSDYTIYKGAIPSTEDSNTYYRKYAIFVGNGAATDKGIPADIDYSFEEMSDATIKALKEENKNSDGSWDVPSGTVHRTVDPYNVPKGENFENNLTGTLDYVRYPVVEKLGQDFYIGSYLGNNGRLTMEIPQGIKITKAVDETLYGTNNTYTFKVETNSAVTPYNVAVYTVNADGSYVKNTTTFNGSLQLSTTAGTDIYVIGLKENVTYTVTEIIATDATYEVKAISLNGSLLNAKDKAEFTLQQYANAEVGFVNTLKPEPQKGVLVVSKEVIINDPALEYDASRVFTFGIYDGNQLVGEKFTLADGQSKTIDNLEAGKTYTVKEENLPTGFTAVAEEIAAEIVANQTTAAHFVNTYDPEPADPKDPDAPKQTDIIATGTKTLSGREWLTTDSFTFTLSELKGAVWNDIATRTVNSQNKNYEFNFANDNDINVSFDAAGDYWFRINEVKPVNFIGGVTYDISYKYFKVVVTDTDIDGYYEISEVVGEAPTTVSSSANNNITVWTATANTTNTYTPSGNDDLLVVIDKTVTDKVGAGIGRDGFTFGLYAVGGTTPIVTSEPTDENGHTTIALSFPAIYVGRSYDFEIKEIVPEDKLNGMEYDPIVYPVTIKIVDNKDGTVTAVVVKTPDEEVEGITVAFENVYDPADAEVTISGTKVMEERNFSAGEFTFELYEDGNSTPKTAVNESKVNGGRFTFETLKLDTIKTYNYTLKEKAGNLGGVTYSEKEYDIEIIVSDDTDNDGNLNYQIKVDGNIVPAADIASHITFTNTYKAEKTEVTLEATKELTGRQLQDDEFKFDLYSADEEFNKDKLIEDDVLNKAGKVTFNTIKYDAAGKYYYLILEDEVDGNGITTDKTQYKVKVEITDDGLGQLHATIYVNGAKINGNIADSIVFTNTYTVADGDIILGGTKHLEGRNLKNGEFTFNLWFADMDNSGQWIKGTLVEQVKNNADGTFSFATRKATLGATYIYFITEDASNPDSTITYDETEYMVVVTTEDNGDGTMKVKYEYTVDGNDAKDISFTNTYTAPPGPNIPQTGDDFNLALWITVLISSILTLAGLVIYRKVKS